jgi:hypothetical protein
VLSRKAKMIRSSEKRNHQSSVARKISKSICRSKIQQPIIGTNVAPDWRRPAAHAATQ